MLVTNKISQKQRIDTLEKQKKRIEEANLRACNLLDGWLSFFLDTESQELFLASTVPALATLHLILRYCQKLCFES